MTTHSSDAPTDAEVDAAMQAIAVNRFANAGQRGDASMCRGDAIAALNAARNARGANHDRRSE